VFIDDATSRLMYGQFCQSETTLDYMKGMRTYVEEYGKPKAFYSDKHSVFRVNREEVKSGAKQTQVGRALKELKIELICAHSPQAKGRVERANKTLQDRLIKEMRLREINSIEEGNRYLEEYMKVLSDKYGVEPAEPEDGHCPYHENLQEVLAIKEQRKVTKNLSIQYENVHYLLETKSPNRLMNKMVDVIKMGEQGVKIQWGGKEVKYSLWEEKKDDRPKTIGSKELEGKWSAPKERKPAKKHPWR